MTADETSFDAATLAALRAVQEVRICTTRQPELAVIIWVVVADDQVFVRSVKGAKGRWYRTVSADGSATLELDGRRFAVHVTPVTDPAAIERASRKYLVKYATSPYAQSMVRADVLGTTMRLRPR